MLKLRKCLLYPLNLHFLIFFRRVPGLKIKTNDPQRPLLRPKERLTQIREQVEQTLTRQKDLDHHWEDQIDVSVFFRVLFPNLTKFWN